MLHAEKVSMGVRRRWRGAAGCKPVPSGEGVRIPLLLPGTTLDGSGNPLLWMLQGEYATPVGALLIADTVCQRL